MSTRVHPAAFVDPAPFKTKLEGEGEGRFIAAVTGAAPDLVVLAGFMRVLKPGFLGAFAGMGYAGPASLQGFGVGGDVYAYLRRSMAACSVSDCGSRIANSSPPMRNA